MFYVEKNCIVTFDGKEFKGEGAFVGSEYLYAYPGKNGVLTDWHGMPLGTWKATSSWMARGSRIFQIEATVDGITYTGRGMGEGMIFRGKAKARSGKT